MKQTTVGGQHWYVEFNFALLLSTTQMMLFLIIYVH